MADIEMSPFVMQSARGAVASGFVHIKQQVHALEAAIIDNSGLAFDLAKTLVESVCRKVLDERSIPYGVDDDLPTLFRVIRDNLPFLPPSVSGEVKARRSLERMLGGLSSAVHGICELRNQYGFASHGGGSTRPELDLTQALLAAETADTIVGFLYRVHQQDRTPPPLPKEVFDNNTAFNDAVDEKYGKIQIFEAEFRPSEVLFQMEPETYQVYLAEFDDGAGKTETPM